MRSSPQHVVSFTLEVMSTAKKRSVSRRDVAGPSEDAEDLIIDVSNPNLRCILWARGRNGSGWVLIRKQAYHLTVFNNYTTP